MRTITLEIKGEVFTFFSDLGVFSKDKIDYGSRVLLETVLENEKRGNLNILDVGCGYGVLGITLGHFLNSNVLASDVNERALHLCKKNLKVNNVVGETIVSNAYENIDDTFDLIITNPPIRAGNTVILDILRNAKDHLKENGSLWFVIRKDQGAKSILKRLEDIYNWQVVKKSKGFYCIIAKIR